MTGLLVLACGALASELRIVLGQQGLADAVEVRYLPANLHNRPERIVPAIDDALADGPDRDVLLGYADCGTGGLLDAYISRRNAQHMAAGLRGRIARLPGAHCYEVYAGARRFAELQAAEPGTFYLTDFLAKHFDVLVWRALGLDRHPELRPAYFGNYRRVVLLSQSGRITVTDAAAAAAGRLGLEFEQVDVGYDGLAVAVGVGHRPPVSARARDVAGSVA